MVNSRPFGVTQSGKTVTCYTITNKNNASVSVLDYGCTIQSLHVYGKDGNLHDIVLGYDDILSYETGSCFYGAFVGRYANRIAKSKFTVDNSEIVLEPNEGQNHLHGVLARTVFDTVAQENSLIFIYLSPDGEESFPGNLKITVKYSLSDDDELILEYRAVSDKDTIVNFTNHSYFNLSGHSSGSVAKQILSINADKITAVDNESIPTGELMDVKDTPFDFTVAKPIGQDYGVYHEQLQKTNGYDHNFVLNKDKSKADCCAFSPDTGIVMECFTTQPGVQFYNANFLEADTASGTGKNGTVYKNHDAFCLETQHFPDSPHNLQFPSVELKAGEEYCEKTVYKFAVR